MKKKKKKGFDRGAGILLPISSLASHYGIGTLGKAAYEFVDKLVEAGQKYWQVLPVGPTSFGDSPYQSFSAFAGNPYFIDLDVLIEEKLLKKADIIPYSWGEENYIDYALLFECRFKVLKKAYKNSLHREEAEYLQFMEDNTYWIKNYSLYMALKEYFHYKEWTLWDDDIKFRKEEAVEKYENKLKEEIDFWNFCQYKFYIQWKKLKSYANEKNIQMIGDIPLYVAMDSSDVWANGRFFELDERKNPIHVAGVPPDAFSDTGQRWGNPLYDWDAMKSDRFIWWRKRMESNVQLYDAIRIDHFIGIVRYYSIPSESPTAIEGTWEAGPGSKLTDVIQSSIGNAKVIAEDLGIVVKSVRKLMKKTGWPGMKILEFAFDGTSQNAYLPHNYKGSHMLVYGGTHDNETLVGFFKDKKANEMKYIYDYLGVKRKADVVNALIRTAYESVADVAIFQMQDILKLDNSARMNFPSTVGENWRWRLKEDEFGTEQIQYLRKLVETFGR